MFALLGGPSVRLRHNVNKSSAPTPINMCGGCCFSALLEGLEDEMERPTFLHLRADAVLKKKIATAAEDRMEARGEVLATWTRPPGRVSFLELFPSFASGSVRQDARPAAAC